MEPIPAEVVDKVWKKVASLSLRRAPKLIQHMTKEQPVVLAYLLAVDDDILNRGGCLANNVTGSAALAQGYRGDS